MFGAELPTKAQDGKAANPVNTSHRQRNSSLPETRFEPTEPILTVLVNW